MAFVNAANVDLRGAIINNVGRDQVNYYGPVRNSRKYDALRSLAAVDFQPHSETSMVF
jgi:hypothetical protein